MHVGAAGAGILRGRTFRVFVSSTFADMKEERGLLFREVYPRLERLCRERGARFQAVDLRWGVNEDSQLDHKTASICLREIERCQQLSPRLNFIMLLGDRYGWQPLPDRIPAPELALIAGALTSGRLGGVDRGLLADWYRRDDNAVPPEYVLQPRTGAALSDPVWQQVERELRRLLRAAVDVLDFAPAERIKYECSLVHQEILHGLGRSGPTAGGASGNVFAYERTIAGLPEDATAGPYRDLEGGLPEARSRERLARLKGELGRQLEDRYWRYGASWRHDRSAIDDPVGFAERVYQDLAGVILADDSGTTEDDDGVEQRLHAEYRAELAAQFGGREDIRGQIATYLGSASDPDPAAVGRPLALVGFSGAGKSTLVARAIADVLAKGGVCVYRFLGRTQSAGTAPSLLRSVCAQIAAVYGRDVDALVEPAHAPGVRELDTLATLLQKCLGLATAEQPLALFLDGLDQIAGADQPGALDWLPRELPPHARLVVSLPPHLEERLPGIDPTRLSPLAHGDARAILARWLEQSSRRLTASQTEAVVQGTMASGLPIDLRLAFMQARACHSYDPPPGGGQANQSVARFFAALEQEHGAELVGTVLGYLLCGRYQGLTEAELLEILARDSRFWKGLLEASHPEHRGELAAMGKIPHAVWSRLFFDLAPYLTERDAGGVPILAVFHARLAVAARERYANSDALRTRFHVGLASYFASSPSWRGDGAEKSTPADMPASCTTDVRQVAELPWQQIRAGQTAEVAATLSDLRFVVAKVETGMLDEISVDYEEAMAMPGIPRRADLDAFARAIHNQRHRLRQFPGKALQQLANLLQWECDEVGKHLTSSSAGAGHRGASFVRQTRRPQLVTEHLRATLMGGEDDFRTCAFSPDGRRVGAAGFSELAVWDLASGQKRFAARFRGIYAPTACDFSPDGSKVAFAVRYRERETGVLLLDAETGQWLGMLEGLVSDIRTCAFHPDGRHLTAVDSCDCKTWNLEQGTPVSAWELQGQAYDAELTRDRAGVLVCLANGRIELHETGSGRVLGACQAAANTLACATVSPDTATVVSGEQGGYLRYFSLESGRELRAVRGDGVRIVACRFHPDGSHLVSVGYDKRVRYWRAADGVEVATLGAHGDRVEACAFSGDGAFVATASNDRTIRVWSCSQGRTAQTLAAHRDRVTTCGFSRDGRLAFTGGHDGTLLAWDRATGQIRYRHERPDRLVAGAVLVHGGDAAVVCGRPGADGILASFMVADGREFAMVGGAPMSMHSVGLAGADDRLVLVHGMGELSMWLLLPGRTPIPMGGFINETGAWAGFPSGKELLFPPASGRLVAVDIATGKPVSEYAKDGWQTFAVAVSPDGQIVAADGGSDEVRLWTKKGEPYGTCRAPSSGFGRGAVRGIAFSPDGTKLVVAWPDRTLGLWDVRERQDVAVLRGHDHDLTFAGFSPGGRWIVSASEDGTVRWWDAQSGREAHRYWAEGPITAAAMSGDGQTVLCGDASGNVYLLELVGESEERLWVTGCRYWSLDAARATEPAARADELRGTWEPRCTGLCPACGQRFALPETIQSFLQEIARGMAPVRRAIEQMGGHAADVVPVRLIPTGTWTWPELECACPACGRPLRFAPSSADDAGA